MKKEQLKRMFPKVYSLWHTYRIKQNNSREVKKKKAYDKYGLKVLEELFQMVNTEKYDVACYYGTLLGLVRDDQLIPWDDDLDFIILNNEGFSWRNFEQDMKKKGFNKYRTIRKDNKVIAQSYKKKNVLCDFSLKDAGLGEEESLYGCYEIPGNKYVNGKPGKYQFWRYLTPKVTKLTKVTLAGIEVLIPENYQELLEAYYGEDWSVPDPSFIPNRESIMEEVTITYEGL